MAYAPANLPANLDDTVIVALGSDLAGPYASSEALLEAAVAEIQARGVRVLARSRWWRSAAWPDPAQPEYRNGVAIVRGKGGPDELLALLRAVEAHFGREPGPRNAPRTLDLDLIAHGRFKLDTPGLVLPHPRAHERLFVMGPLAEIAPAWRDPISGTTAEKLAAAASVGLDATPIIS